MKRPTWRVRDNVITKGANLTLRESLVPLSLVTILFFLWVCIEAFLASLVYLLLIIVRKETC